MSDSENTSSDTTKEATDVAEATQGEEHEEHHSSLSARVLKGLFLIVIGCGFGLWAAPKLAPLLPQGLAPVAEFLMPGQSIATTEVIALRTEVEAKLKALQAKPSSSLTQADIDKAITAYGATNAETLAKLQDQLGATDGQDIEARLATAESRLERVTAELAAMSERLSMQITENGAALSEEAAAKLSGYQAAITGMKAQLDALAANNGTLNQRIDEVSTSSARRVKQAEEDANAKVASTATTKLLTDINSALDSGASFQAALDGLAKIAAIAPPLELTSIAPTGTTSWASLRGEFSEVAHAALRANTQANADNGVIGKFGAFLRTQVGTRSLERREGGDTNAILSRIEDELIRGNLTKALIESNSLPEAPKAAMTEWLAALTRLSNAQSAMAQLTSTLGVTN